MRLIRKAHLEDVADEGTICTSIINSLTDYERGEYDCFTLVYPALEESEESNKDYTEGFRQGYEYAQQMGANSNE